MGGYLCGFSDDKSRQESEPQAEIRPINRRRVHQQPSFIYNDARHTHTVLQGKNTTIQAYTHVHLCLTLAFDFHEFFLIFSKLY